MDQQSGLLFRLRGLHRPLTVLTAILLKYFFGQTTALPVFLAGLSVVAMGETLRVWSAAHLQGKQAVRQIAADALCTSGPYSFVRNPLYTGHILIGIGLATMIAEWYAFVLIPITQVIVYSMVIAREEQFLAREFGDAYDEYRSQTTSMFPGFQRYRKPESVSPKWWAGLKNENHVVILVIMCAAIYALFVT